MKWVLPVFGVLTLFFLAAPRSQSCYQLVPEYVECDGCGNMIETYGCIGPTSTGFSSCSPLGSSIPCQGPDGGCSGRVWVARGNGVCGDASRSDALRAAKLWIAVTDEYGAYSLRLATATRSCGTTEGS